MKHQAYARVAAAAALGFIAPAWALPATTVQWIQQTGTTSGADVVEVWVRLTSSPQNTDPLYLDNTTTSFSPADYAQLSNFVTIDSVYNGGTATCSTNFFPEPPLNACFDTASAWRFDFNYDPQTSFYQPFAAPLLPGQSLDFLFGIFTPQNGPVAAGLYSFTSASLQIGVSGTDANGDTIYGGLSLGATCDSSDDSCAFTRNVTGVPEPGRYALMALGLVGIGLARRLSRDRV